MVLWWMNSGESPVKETLQSSRADTIVWTRLGVIEIKKTGVYNNRVKYIEAK